jgi:hypothetical protein
VAWGDFGFLQVCLNGRQGDDVFQMAANFEEEGMEFGIQFIAPAARSVTLQQTANATGAQKLGLLIPEFDPMESGDSLLTPPLTFGDLREFEVEDQGELSLVRATQLLERTQRFELFHIAQSRSA